MVRNEKKIVQLKLFVHWQYFTLAKQIHRFQVFCRRTFLQPCAVSDLNLLVKIPFLSCLGGYNLENLFA